MSHKCVLSENEKRFILESLHVITTPNDIEDEQDDEQNPKNMIQKSTEAMRIDGRQPFDFRNVTILFQEERLGQVQVSIGKTRVMAVVTCDIASPFTERPTEGFLVFNTELSPMAGLHYAHHRNIQSETSIEISRVIERALRGSRAIDTEALCIVSGEKVWSLRVDLHVLDDHGNVLDCAHLAAISALLHFRRPEVTIAEGGQVIIHSTQDREPIPLSIHHIPVCVSFGFFQDGTVCCVDPSLKEEEILAGTMTVAVNTHEQVCAVQKGGGVPLPVQQIMQCTRIAALKARDLTTLIEQALRNDQEQRKLKKLPAYARPASKKEKETIDLNQLSEDEQNDDDDDVIFMGQDTKQQFTKDVKDFLRRR